MCVNFQICFAYNIDTLTIVDVTDKSNMFLISRNGYEGATYTHQVKQQKFRGFSEPELIWLSLEIR